MSRLHFALKIELCGKRTANAGESDAWTYDRFGLVLVHRAGPDVGRPVITYRTTGRCHVRGAPVPVITTLGSAVRGAPQWMRRAVADCHGRGGVTLEESAPFCEWHRANARKPGAVFDLRPGAFVELDVHDLELLDATDDDGFCWAAK